MSEKGITSWIFIFHEKCVPECLHKFETFPVVCSHLTNTNWIENCCPSLSICTTETVLILYMHGFLERSSLSVNALLIPVCVHTAHPKFACYRTFLKDLNFIKLIELKRYLFCTYKLQDELLILVNEGHHFSKYALK